MCLIAVKYIPEQQSWVGVKNRDRVAKPVIRIRKSFRRGMERLYMWDDKTKYTEGINEFGVAILSAGMDSERDTIDGLAIRTALFEQTVEGAVQKIVDLKVRGRTFVFSKDIAWQVGIEKGNGKDFMIADVEMSRQEHHVFISVDDAFQEHKRWRTAMKETQLARSAMELFDGMSSTDDENPQDNPLIVTDKRKAMKTTGQVMILPSEMTMHYRAMWGDVRFSLDKLNSPIEKTFFEIVSTRKLISFGEESANS